MTFLTKLKSDDKLYPTSKKRSKFRFFNSFWRYFEKDLNTRQIIFNLMMSMETNTAIEEFAEEFLKEKKYFEDLGLEVLGSRDGNSENPNKTYYVRKKK